MWFWLCNNSVGPCLQLIRLWLQCLWQKHWQYCRILWFDFVASSPKMSFFCPWAKYLAECEMGSDLLASFLHWKFHCRYSCWEEKREGGRDLRLCTYHSSAKFYSVAESAEEILRSVFLVWGFYNLDITYKKSVPGPLQAVSLLWSTEV